jgi:hypothetical protein
LRVQADNRACHERAVSTHQPLCITSLADWGSDWG